MQNALWKLMSIAGVIAIGILVVTEVQKQLSGNPNAAQNAQSVPQSDDQERVVEAPTEMSDFERQLASNPPSQDDGELAADVDDDPFRADLFGDSQFDSDAAADRADRVVVAGTDAAEDNRDPFSFEQREPVIDFGDADADAVPIPVDNVSFAEETTAGGTSDSTDSDPFDFSTESQPENVEETFDLFTADDVDTAAPAAVEENVDADEFRSIPTVPDSVPVREPAPDDASPRQPLPSNVNSLIFVPRDNDAATDNADDQPLRNDLDDDGPRSRPNDLFEPDLPEPAGDLLALPEPADASADDAALRPTPEPAESLPDPFTAEPDAAPRDSSTAADAADETSDFETLMFGADDTETAPQDALPFVEESSESPAEPTSDEHRTTPPRTDRSLPEERLTRPRHEDAFDESRLDLRPHESEPREFRFDQAPADTGSALEEDESEPGRYRLSPADDQADALEDSRRLRRDSDTRGNGDSIEILPRSRHWNDPDEPRFRRDESPSDARRGQATSTGVLRPHLTVRKQMPNSATLGRLLKYSLTVTNEGNSTASNVIVEDVVPAAARIEGAEPPADYNEERRSLVWELGSLPPGESRDLSVHLIPTEQGVLSSVATVRFNTQVTASTVVQAPRLTLKLAAPRQVRMGAETQLRYIVRNEGDGTATDVMLRSDLPSGLRHPVGNDLEYNIESLEPHEEREIVLDVIAAEPGKFTSTAELLAAGVPGEMARATVNIIGQQIQVVRQGPPRRYVGRSAVYSNILTNETAFGASEIRVIEQVPDGMKFERASHGGIYNPQQRAVVWTLDEIDPGESKTLKIELVAAEAGEHESSVTVVENAGFETAARHVTAVEDLHNIGTRMSRLDGPVSVGEEFGFDIAVQNRGTTDATGIQLTIDLPDGVQGVSVGKGGPRAEPDIRQGQLQYRFQPVPRIQPGDDMTFRINLKAMKALSNAVVNARIRYDQMQKELVTSEAVTATID